MAKSIPFGAGSTADHVLAGVDLARRRIVVTECDNEIGFETLKALAANGAHVIGLARTLSAARSACAMVGRLATPLACDWADLTSVEAAAESIWALGGPLDAVVTHAKLPRLPTLHTRYGIELQFLVNHISRFVFVNRISDTIRSDTGRIVVVSNDASFRNAPREGVMFDNLDAGQFYDSYVFLGQAKLATALYAKELSRRLASRRVSVNSVHAGFFEDICLHGRGTAIRRLPHKIARLFTRSAAQNAGSLALLAASPQVAGITGEYWADCQIARGNPLLADEKLGKRLWEISEQIVSSRIAGTNAIRDMSPEVRINRGRSPAQFMKS
jgi:WW domain-containing oxidoreductase